MFRKFQIVFEIPIGDYTLSITHNYNSMFINRHKQSVCVVEQTAKRGLFDLLNNKTGFDEISLFNVFKDTVYECHI